MNKRRRREELKKLLKDICVEVQYGQRADDYIAFCYCSLLDAPVRRVS